jgi:hypothetical protein
MKYSNKSSSNSLQELFQKIGMEVVRGIKHGHFDYQITGASNKNGNRQIVLKAGLTHRFDMSITELPADLISTATFYPLAHDPQTATPKTSAKDARVDTENKNEGSRSK